MVIFNIAFMALAGLGNPASAALSSIVQPTPLLLSLAAILSKVLFIIGVWLFRRFFMSRNWRFTCAWTHGMTALDAIFTFAIVYNWAGIGQTGAFYCFGDTFLEV